MQPLSLVNRINWEEKYADLKPAWYENPKILKVARERIAEVAGTLAVGATFVYFCKVATPMVIMGTFWGVGVGLTACAVAAFAVSYLLAHPNPWAHPEYKREQAKKIAQEIAEQKLSYLEIQNRYDNLPIKQALFTNSEWNLLVFEREATSAISYDAFVLRNGLESLKYLEKKSFEQVQALLVKKLEGECSQLTLLPFVERYEKSCASLQLSIEPFCTRIIEKQVDLMFNGNLSYAQFIANNASSIYFKQVLENLSPKKKDFFSTVKDLELQASHKKEEIQHEANRRLSRYTWDYERDKERINTSLEWYQAFLSPLENALKQAQQALLSKQSLLASLVAEQESYRHVEKDIALLREEILQKETALARFDWHGCKSRIAEKQTEVERIKNTTVQGVPAARAALAQMEHLKKEIKTFEKELASYGKDQASLNDTRNRLAIITAKAANTEGRLGELTGILDSTRHEIALARQHKNFVEHQLEENKRRLAPEKRVLERELKFAQDRYAQDCRRLNEGLQEELSFIERRLLDRQEETLLAYRKKTS